MENYAKMLIILNITNRTNTHGMCNRKVLLEKNRQKYFKSIKNIFFIPCKFFNITGITLRGVSRLKLFWKESKVKRISNKKFSKYFYLKK